MRKTDKKIDNAIRNTLTVVCDIALKECAGFSWLTHTVDYQRFPASLKIVCVFETHDQLVDLINQKQDKFLCDLINKHLAGIDVQVKDIHKQVSFDSEEKCLQENNGNWRQRLG